jgi:ribonucleoside-diphosphate reductase alpha chain
MFTKEEVYKSTLEYFNGDDMRTSIWMDKYALKNNNEYLEKTPDDMHKRLAKEFARIEQKYPNPLEYEEIYQLLSRFRYVIPGGSILYGVGNIYSISSLGNCFVIGNNADSYGSIFNIDEEQAQLMKRRAGVGHDLSHLRPALTPVTNAAGTSTGSISFAERYSNTTREVGQNNRRGALMLTLDINHPDIERFITSKDDLTKITGANISVKIDDRFMKAVETNSIYYLTFIHGNPKGDHYHTEIEIKAKELWNKLIHQAWKSAEPGVLFWDKIKSESIPSCYGKEWEETSTNPCGEIPLCPYDSCRLLSVNLYSFVENPFTDKAYFNYDKFKDVAYKAQRLMDDIVDLEEEKINLILNKIENDPEPEEIKSVEKNLWIKIKSRLLDGRRTGLSAIGLADCFAGLGYLYGSNKSIELAEEIYKQFAISAYKSSIDMSGERGPFPIYDYYKEKDNSFLQRLPNEMWKYSRRNICLLTIPPSGTISMKAGISSGIEPVYQLYYKRRYKILENTEEKKQYDFIDANGDKWREYIVAHPKFKEWMYINNKQTLLPDFKSIESDNLVEQSPYYKSTAYEIDPIQRIKLQGAIQKWIDHSISSTLNLPEEISEADVSDIYFTAWKEGLKGVTIYRNNCRTGVLVDIDKSEDKFEYVDAPKRLKTLDAELYKIKVKGLNYCVLIGLFNNKPYELFAFQNGKIEFDEYVKGKITKLGKKHYKFTSELITIENILEETENADEKTFTLFISGMLRHRINPQFILEWIDKADLEIISFGKAISRILKKYIQNNEKSKDLCPECNSEMIYEAGCKTCKSCGWSRC